MIGANQAPPPATPNATTALPTATSPIAPAGYRRFTAPGISFVYPSGWVDQLAVSGETDGWTRRSIAYLFDGPPFCGFFDAPSPARTIGPLETCDAEGQQPGSLHLYVSEWLRPVPGDLPYRQGVTFDPRQPWDGGGGRWYVMGPDEGLYSFYFSPPYDELGIREPDIRAVMASVELSAWTHNADPVVDGWTLLQAGSASFAFPSNWHAYSFTPGHVGMNGTGSPLALVASTPLESCEPVETCHLTEAPPGSVVVKFHEGSAPSAVDWSDATERVGGQPARYQEDAITPGIRLRSWDVRLPGNLSNGVFGIEAAISGTVDPDLLAQLDGIISRMEFPVPEAP